MSDISDLLQRPDEIPIKLFVKDVNMYLCYNKNWRLVGVVSILHSLPLVISSNISETTLNMCQEMSHMLQWTPAKPTIEI